MFRFLLTLTALFLLSCDDATTKKTTSDHDGNSASNSHSGSAPPSSGNNSATNSDTNSAPNSGKMESCDPECDESFTCVLGRCVEQTDSEFCEEDEIFIEELNICVVPGCDNGILDGDETDVDCGGSCPPCSVCGDGIVEAEEECDSGGVLETECAYGEASCMLCNSQCELFAGQVRGYCGDGIIQPQHEVCEASNVGNTTCADSGLGIGGDLTCSGDCSFNTSMCSDSVQLSTLEFNNCGIRRSDSQVICWNHRNDRASTPTSSFLSVAAGANHGCGIRFDGTLECWGENNNGRATPPGGTFKALDSGREFSCAIRQSDHRLLCWGVINTGNSTPPTEPAVAIAAGFHHACAIHETTRLPFCWGYDYYGQADPPDTPALKAISAGFYHTCALVESTGIAICWGDDEKGGASPPTNTSFVAISGGGDHTCGIVENTLEIECWGSNESGQSNPPPGQFDAVAAGSYHTCARRIDGEVICWGSGNFNAPTL